MKNKAKEIAKVRNEAGNDIIFNMGITQLFEDGMEHWRSVSQTDLDEYYNFVYNEEKDFREKGKHPIMTAEFKFAIAEVAWKLANDVEASVVDIINYQYKHI